MVSQLASIQIPQNVRERLEQSPEPTRAINTKVKLFEPLNHLERFEAEYPAEFALLRLTYVHPQYKPGPDGIKNIYTGTSFTESYTNVGEHCIAVGFCAERIALALENAGFLSAESRKLVISRALVHDATKAFEGMRRDAQNAGHPIDVYGVSAYEKLASVLKDVDFPVSDEVAEYLSQAGRETGHNSLKDFVRLGADHRPALVDGRLAEKIVHLADDMTFTSEGYRGKPPITIFLTPWERMLASRFLEKYLTPLWDQGIAAQKENGQITAVKDLKQVPQGFVMLGDDYANLQVIVGQKICRELQLLIDFESTADPENFIRSLVEAGIK